MEKPKRLVWSIDQRIELERSLAFEEPDPKTRWQLERRTARFVWQRDSRRHIEALGRSFFDFYQWELDKSHAKLVHRANADRHRRLKGNEEIEAALAKLEGVERPDGAYRITKARRRVISAIIALASESGRLYCSYDALARAARVSARTAFTVRSELERLGILERLRTGGKSLDGGCQSNKYTVKWNALRDLLSVDNRWDTSYPDNTRDNVARPVPNVYFNYQGCAHFYRSDRQRRRTARRMATLKGRVITRAEVENLVENLVENAGGRTVKERGGTVFHGLEKEFCTVTELNILKGLDNQPERPPLLSQRPNESSEGVSGAFPVAPAPAPTSFSVESLSARARAMLGSVLPEQQPWLLAEIDQMVRESACRYDPEEHAEDILELLLDSDPTLTMRRHSGEQRTRLRPGRQTPG